MHCEQVYSSNEWQIGLNDKKEKNVKEKWNTWTIASTKEDTFCRDCHSRPTTIFLALFLEKNDVGAQK
jgi:hypothetical protein